MADIITRRLAELATIVCVALVLFIRASATSRGNWDDLAVTRAAAWLTSCSAGAELPRRLQEHLEQYGGSLPKLDQQRYQLRSELRSTYPLSAPLVRALEQSGRTPVLRNVVIANWLQHVFVLAVVVLLVGWRQSWLALAVFIAALSIAHVWPGQAADWMPFQRNNLTWTASPPRGASTLAWFGAVVAGATLTGPRRIATVSGLMLLSWLCHRSMGLLCLAASVPPLALAALARRRGARLPPRWIALAGFCGAVLLAAAAQLALLWSESGRFPLLFTANGLGGAADVRHAGSLLLGWGLLCLAALELWRRSRAHLPTEPRGTVLREVGDVVALLLGATSAVALGLNVAHPTLDVWFGRFFLVWETGMRLGALPNLLFFALLALCLSARAPRVVAPLTLAGAVLSGLIVGRAVLQLQPRPLPEQKRSLPKLLAKGAEAYADEPQYYLSVAGEVVERGCGGWPR